METLANISAATYALTCDEKGEGLSEFFKRWAVMQTRPPQEAVEALEKALEGGCMEADVANAVCEARKGLLRPDAVELVVQETTRVGWKHAFGNAYFERVYDDVIVSRIAYLSNYVISFDLDGATFEHGSKDVHDITSRTPLTMYPVRVAKHLMRNCVTPKYLSYLEPQDDVTDEEVHFYVRGYDTLHVRVGDVQCTPLKLPEYAVAKSASGLSDEHFRRMWDVLGYFHEMKGMYSQDVHLFEADFGDLTDVMEWVSERYPDIVEPFEDIMTAWLFRVKPLCHVMPGEVPRFPRPRWMRG